jgi:Ca2+-binding RTX toxin-like protein
MVNTIVGTDASDDLDGTGLDDLILGYSGNDQLWGWGGWDTLNGGDGDDNLIGGAGADKLNGGNGSDFLIGGSGADQLNGGAGSEDAAVYSYSTVAVTVTIGGTGRGGDAEGDVIGSDVEALFGGGSGDALNGSAGADSLFGLEGNDVLRGGAGADRLEGGSGTDLATYWGAVAAVTVYLTSGTGSGGDAQGDTFAGIENVNGGKAGDTIAGNAAANILNGYEGNDALTGVGGNDVLTGAGGKDTLTGGIGADRFVYAAIGESVIGANADRITDFSHAQGDRIDLSTIDANTAAAGNQAFTFIGTGLYTHHAGELRAAITSPGVTTIAGDVNGNGTSDFHIVLTGGIALQAADFML